MAPNPPSICEIFSKTISFNDLVAKADLNPPAQNKPFPY